MSILLIEDILHSCTTSRLDNRVPISGGHRVPPHRGCPDSQVFAQPH